MVQVGKCFSDRETGERPVTVQEIGKWWPEQ